MSSDVVEARPPAGWTVTEWTGTGEGDLGGEDTVIRLISSRTLTNKPTQTHTFTHSDTHIHTDAHTGTHIHTHTHKHLQTHTHHFTCWPSFPKKG